MTNITLLQMPTFKKAYKKLHKQSKIEVDHAIRTIITDPKIGVEKKGDLVGVFIYKFKIHKQEMLLAYEWDPKTRMLLALSFFRKSLHDRVIAC